MKKFLKCPICGKIVEVINDTNVPLNVLRKTNGRIGS